MQFYWALCLVFFTSVTSEVDITTIFTICKDRNNMNECLKGAIQDALKNLADGNKELNTPVSEPISLDGITIPAGLGTVHVEQVYKNVKLHNVFKSSQVKDVKVTITPDGFDAFIDLFSPEYKMEADYKFNGRILLLPITGEGPCVIKLDDIEAQLQISADTFEKDGKTYGNVNKVTMQLLPKKMTFQFDNLFNGDKTLGDAMNKIMNENWETLFHDVKTGYQDMVAAEAVKFANIIFHNFEYKVFFP